MSCFAQYRLPHADTYTRIEQTAGDPLQLSSCLELNGKQGFVVVPFQVDSEQSILLIRPDKITQHQVEEASLSSVHIIHTEDHRQEYAIDFANFHAQLENDTFQKIVLSRCATIETDDAVDPQQLFLLACQRYPRLFISLVQMPDGSYWLTATPEILLEGQGEQWRTIALAGTMQLQGDELKGEGETVRWSTKNIQEQRFVATYIAERLERFLADRKETFVQDGPRTVRAAQLVHLRSDFMFHLTDRSRVGSLLEQLHPTPAVCGLPKREALQFIVKHERTPREYYSGFMGPLNLSDETHLYVSLRCMHIEQNNCHLFAGGGLLKDSILEQEWQETEAKMQTMRGILEN